MFFLCGQDGPVKHPALRYFTDLTAENRPDFKTRRHAADQNG